MLQSRSEIIDRFANLELIDHPRYSSLKTFSFLPAWANTPIVIELPFLKVIIHGIDYLRKDRNGPDARLLRFQQDHFRLWYHVEGGGILQNVTTNVFGPARPGLLGIMEPGQRHSYLHQRGTFECFLMDFSLMPSSNSHCYWNTEVEGKCVLNEVERIYVENLIFDMLRQVSNKTEFLGLSPLSRLIELIVVLFEKKLLVLTSEQFPRNKPKSLVALASTYMNTHYATFKHQSELADECKVDINYLNILFKRETGKTLNDYLTDLRMEHARYLLEERILPVVDIAERIGYPNSNSFTRAFRRCIGMSPTDYRANHGTTGPHISPKGSINPDYGAKNEDKSL